MSFAKRVLACLSAGFIAVSAAGCGEDTTWVAKYGNDNKVPAGVYLWFQLSAYNSALTKLKEADETVTVVKKDAKVDDKDAFQWIVDEAQTDVREYIAVEQKFNELGLKLTDEEKESAASMVEYYWDQYYKDTCNDNGISSDSLEKIFLNNYMKSDLLKAYYISYDVVENGETVTKDGLEKVSEEDVDNYYSENNARVKMIAVQLKDGKGTALTEEKDINAERARAEDYLSRLKKGEDFDKLVDEYNDYYEDLKEAASAAEESTDDTDSIEIPSNPTPGEPEPAETSAETTEVTTTEETTTEAEDETTAETTEDEDSAETTAADGETEEETLYPNETIIKKDSASPSQKVEEAAFKMEIGTPEIVEDTDNNIIYVIERYDILERKADLITANFETIVSEMKTEDFDKVVKELGEKADISFNDKAVDRYTADKLKYEE